MNASRHSRFLRATNICVALSIVLIGSLGSFPARADTWRVDLIVFRFLGSADETGKTPEAPKLRNAIELDDTPRLSAAGIKLLPATDFALADHWSRLKGSPQFRPLIRLAWTQDNPPNDNGPRLRLRAGEKFTLGEGGGLGAREFQEVDGSIALHLGRYLHLDTDLLFTQAGDTPASWALDESRRMRSEELHHLDSPRLGVIAKVTKVVPTAVPVAAP